MNVIRRSLAVASALVFAAALPACGFRQDDPELEEAMQWSRTFKAEYPEVAREIGQICKNEIGRSPWTQDGSLALSNCVRAKASERGYA